MGQISSELLASLDIILRKIRNSNIYMGEQSIPAIYSTPNEVYRRKRLALLHFVILGPVNTGVNNKTPISSYEKQTDRLTTFLTEIKRNPIPRYQSFIALY